MLHRLRPSVALMLVALATPAASAESISRTGTFADDEDVALVAFTVDAPSALVTLRTFSYAGGINAAGQAIAPGGFDPVLSLFDGSGLLIGSFDDPAGPSDEEVRDLSLASGTYTVALTQYDNFAVGPELSDGFLFEGEPTFTSVFGAGSGLTGPFLDASGNRRTGSFALDIVVNAVPEPASLVVLAPGVLLVVALARRQAVR